MTVLRSRQRQFSLQIWNRSNLKIRSVPALRVAVQAGEDEVYADEGKKGGQET